MDGAINWTTSKQNKKRNMSRVKKLPAEKQPEKISDSRGLDKK